MGHEGHDIRRCTSLQSKAIFGREWVFSFNLVGVASERYTIHLSDHITCLALYHYMAMLLSAARSYPPLPAPVEALFGQHAHLADSLPVPLLQETCSCPRPFTLAIFSAGLICLPFPWFRSFLIFKVSPNKISSDWGSLHSFSIKWPPASSLEVAFCHWDDTVKVLVHSKTIYVAFIFLV